MNCLAILARMEVVGIGVDPLNLSRIIDLLNREKLLLETKGYSLAGRRFSFSSSKEVAKILHVKGSTSKKVLEKNTNPLSELILQWRKISNIISKIIQPLVYSIEDKRIHGSYVTHTATGRISMNEPNLQSIPKNFHITNPITMKSITISCRNAFIPRENFVLVSADYCQLELRLLAHLSQDEKLCTIMRRKGDDIFKSMAAQWNKVEENEVSDDLRQRCKQISYGIIYGMGAKSLGEQLGVEEQESQVFMDTFQETYPKLKVYTSKIIEQCRKNGYVETLTGRRRYLPNILSSSVSLKNQAERQAVNTSIQGSAADLVKNTMVELEEKWCLKLQEGTAALVLHLHDELLYEVSKDLLKRFVVFLKETMENSVELSIPFPVKVKVGPSWEQLKEYL